MLNNILPNLENTVLDYPIEYIDQKNEYRNVVSSTDDSMLNIWEQDEDEDGLVLENAHIKKYQASTNGIFSQKNMYIGLGVFIFAIFTFLIYKKFKNNI